MLALASVINTMPTATDTEKVLRFENFYNRMLPLNYQSCKKTI